MNTVLSAIKGVQEELEQLRKEEKELQKELSHISDLKQNVKRTTETLHKDTSNVTASNVYLKAYLTTTHEELNQKQKQCANQEQRFLDNMKKMKETWSHRCKEQAYLDKITNQKIQASYILDKAVLRRYKKREESDKVLWQQETERSKRLQNESKQAATKIENMEKQLYLVSAQCESSATQIEKLQRKCEKGVQEYNKLNSQHEDLARQIANKQQEFEKLEKEMIHAQRSRYQHSSFLDT